MKRHDHIPIASTASLTARLAMMLLILMMGTKTTAQILIQFNGNTASVTVPTIVKGVTYSINGANVVINSSTTTTEYTYRVSGTSTDGSLTINGNYKLTLALTGVNLTNRHGGAAIDVECGKRVSVELASGTVNTLADAATGTQKAALYFKGHPEFKGSGTLNVTGNLKHAICAKEYIQFKSSLGYVNILGAVADGIHCGKGKVENEHNYFEMNGGTVNINHVGNDGVDADDYGVIRITGGAISANIGDEGTGLKADSTLNISGGQVNLSVNGHGSEAIKANHTVNISGGETYITVTGEGAKGIRSKKQTTGTVLNGGQINFTGGSALIEISGGDYILGTDTTRCVGVHADAGFTQTDGYLRILAMGLDVYSHQIEDETQLTGGTMETIRIPWVFHPHACQYDMSVFAIVKENGVSLSDYSQVAVGAFIDGQCSGYGYFESADYGIIRIHSAINELRDVSFRLYDYATATEYPLSADRAVRFADTSVAGTPSSPVVLELFRGLMGDVNIDGEINVTDVMMTVSYIIGNNPKGFHPELADLNDDGEINIVDAMMIVNIIL